MCGLRERSELSRRGEPPAGYLTKQTQALGIALRDPLFAPVVDRACLSLERAPSRSNSLKLSQQGPPGHSPTRCTRPSSKVARQTRSYKTFELRYSEFELFAVNRPILSGAVRWSVTYTITIGRASGTPACFCRRLRRMKLKEIRRTWQSCRRVIRAKLTLTRTDLGGESVFRCAGWHEESVFIAEDYQKGTAVLYGSFSSCDKSPFMHVPCRALCPACDFGNNDSRAPQSGP